MKWVDLKYLLAYIIPISAFIGIYFGGMLSYLTFIIAFILIPLVEQMGVGSRKNLEATDATIKSGLIVFDLFLFLNVPIIMGLLYYFFESITSIDYSYFEGVGLLLSIGIVLGASGINVAHELGHKDPLTHRIAAKVLLLPSLYMHFIIEHNRGHHKYVATLADPATSRKGESLYGFWIRSTIHSYVNAWKLESRRLRHTPRINKIFLNEMIYFTLIQILYLSSIYYIYGGTACFAAIIVAIVSFLLLESINYIEHYGLLRGRNEDGRYERVMPEHSWNSNHHLGRIMLYELTRHSDHHYLANKKYQVLNHHDQSPQLPYGYPTSILIAAVPPLWFRIMHTRIAKFRNETE